MSTWIRLTKPECRLSPRLARSRGWPERRVKVMFKSLQLTREELRKVYGKVNKVNPQGVAHT